MSGVGHTGCVWDADFLPNGDLITACADHFVRIWTTASDRVAAADELEAYNASMAAESSSGQSMQLIRICGVLWQVRTDQPSGQHIVS